MVSAEKNPAVVMDIGTGYTKLGFGGNLRPSFVFPTAVATRPMAGAAPSSAQDADYYTGHDALKRVPIYDISYPLERGIVTDWSLYEKVLFDSFFKYLQVDATQHTVVLTEPPLNPPEARETLAEIMFEMFQVPALHVGVQAVLALYGMRSSESGQQAAPAPGASCQASFSSLCGTVVDAGDGSTQVIPVVDGYVLGSSVKTLPVAGADVTAFIQTLMRQRGEPLPLENSVDVCRAIKEQHCYTARDIAAEFARLEADPARHVKRHTGLHVRGGAPYTLDVAYERFLAPEVFFSPEIAGVQCPGLPAIIDDAIQSCPIDSRRDLYSRIYLSGGSTLFRNFDKRLQLEVQRTVDARLSAQSSGVQVSVHSDPLQHCAVWFGASLLSTTPGFEAVCRTKAEYEEYGPSICRSNSTFSSHR